MRVWTVGIVLCAMVAAGCGSGSSGEAPPTRDPSIAATCGELTRIYVGIHQEFIDGFGAGTFEDYFTAGPEIITGQDVFIEKLVQWTERWRGLGCEKSQLQVVCDQEPLIDPLGDAGVAFITDNYPCFLEDILGPVESAETKARLSAWRQAHS